MVSAGAMAAGIGYLQQQGGNGNVYPGMEMVPSVPLYPHPRMMSPYPASTYPSPSGTAGAVPFTAQLHVGLATKKEHLGVPPIPPPMGMGGPYNLHLQ